MSDGSMVKLEQSLQRTSLRSLVKVRKTEGRRSMLLVDCSYSMNGPTESGERRVDAMRLVVDALRQTNAVPMVGFGVLETVKMIETIPEPGYGTPMGEAIKFAKEQGATHLVLISDGHPNDRELALFEAEQFGGQIDTFFIGLATDEGARFLTRLAGMTGGQSGVTDLGDPLQLSGQIIGLIGDGTAPAAIQL